MAEPNRSEQPDRDARIARLVTALLSYPALAVVLVLTLWVRACYGD